MTEARESFPTENEPGRMVEPKVEAAGIEPAQHSPRPTAPESRPSCRTSLAEALSSVEYERAQVLLGYNGRSALAQAEVVAMADEIERLHARLEDAQTRVLDLLEEKLSLRAEIERLREHTTEGGE